METKADRPFTTIQAGLLLAATIMMEIDLLITTWGRAAVPGFSEANPLFARFMTDPVAFLASIAVSKMLVLALLVIVVLILNRFDEDKGIRNAGTLTAIAAAGGIGAMLGTLVLLNFMR